jgi:hypothetical protein
MYVKLIISRYMVTTTIRMPDGLMAQLKKAARERGTTVSALIIESVRETVSRKPKRGPRVKPPVSSVYGSAPPEVDISDSAALHALMDEQVIRDAGIVKLR